MADITAPQFSSQFFDPELKRLVPIEEVLLQNEGKFRECQASANHRLRDLQELETAIKESQSILDIRERDAIQRIRDECQSLVNILRRREEELVEMVRGDCEVQRGQLHSASQQVAGKITSVSECVEDLSKDDRGPNTKLAAIFTCETLLKESSFFDVPQSQSYTISSRPISADAHLSLTRQNATMHVPAALTIAMPKSDVRVVPERGVSSTGILHYIGTGGNRRDFTNPAVTNAVEITCSVGVAVGDIAALVDEPLATPQEFRTKSDPTSRIVVDFGSSRAVNLEAYALQHGHSEEHAALRSWKIVGSNDYISWTVLDTRRNVREAAKRPFQRSMYLVTESAEPVASPVAASKSPTGEEGALPDHAFFRYIGVAIDGPNAAGKNMYHLELSGIEIFGTLRSAGAH